MVFLGKFTLQYLRTEIHHSTGKLTGDWVIEQQLLENSFLSWCRVCVCVCVCVFMCVRVCVCACVNTHNQALSCSVRPNSLQPHGLVVFGAPLSMEFSRQEYWNWLPLPPPGDHPDPGTEPSSLLFPALAGIFFTTAALGKAPGNWKNPGNTCRLPFGLMYLPKRQQE